MNSCQEIIIWASSHSFSSIVSTGGGSSANKPPPLPVKSLTMSSPAGRPQRRKTVEVFSHTEDGVNMHKGNACRNKKNISSMQYCSLIVRVRQSWTVVGSGD